jgi:hypothetical protein
MRKLMYVYFGEADIRSWYMAPMAQGFTHCFVYEHHTLGGYDCFIKIENLHNHVESCVIFGGANHIPRAESYRVVRVALEIDPIKKYHDYMPINCVSLVKKQLGISQPWIILPKQLFNHLITLGGEEI